MSDGALRGVRVVDFSTLLPGPLASLLLTEAGAEVIKIEKPGHGDEMRHYQPRWGDDSANFHLLNRGKQSVAIDLKSDAGREQALGLIEDADVLIEQFRPGVMARLGLSWETVRARNPDIIYCSITGYGQSGPRSARAGHDLNYQADSGLLALACGTRESPAVPPALIADIAGGSYPALFNILLALRERDCSGEGAYLDIAMAENLFPFLYWAQGEGQVAGVWPGNGDALVIGGSVRYALYPAADERFVAVAALEEKFWQRLCDAIGLADTLRNDAHTPSATRAGLAAIFASAPSSHWAGVFERADCCCSIVQSLEQAQADPQFVARDVFSARLAGRGDASMAALPVPIDQRFRAGGHRRCAPRLGEHDDLLLSGHRQQHAQQHSQQNRQQGSSQS